MAARQINFFPATPVLPYCAAFMAKAFAKLFSASSQTRLLSRPWLFVIAAMLLTMVVRVRLGDMPLERDEGEYAYAGQLILQGEPPYKDAFNMKLPGTYLAYAVSMAIFGQTPTGIHIGLALANAATIWLMFLLGRKLIDPLTGVVAAVAYALISMTPDVLGLAGHATHYVVLPAIGGILLLLRALETRSLKFYFLAGLLFGTAFVMKQHGVFFGIFGGLYLLWSRWLVKVFSAGGERKPRWRRASGSIHTEDSRAVNWRSLFGEVIVYSVGCLLPYLLIVAWLAAAGVFSQFWFWTMTYGSKYAGGVPLVKAADVISYTLRGLVGPNIVVWLLPWAGMLMMWWDDRLDTNRRVFLCALFGFSLLAISVGFYFRQHYFILLLPVLCLLIGLGVSRSIRLLQGDKSLELILALGVTGAAGLAFIGILFLNGALWFADSPRKAVERIYTTSAFADTRDLADIIRSNTPPTARIAVVGSEPQVYFYSHRKSATGHIYTYALMETQPYAATMQDEMISQIESNRPDYVVYVQNYFSWLTTENSHKGILEWWPRYWQEQLQLERTIPTKQGEAEFASKDPAPAGSTGNYLLLLKRK